MHSNGSPVFIWPCAHTHTRNPEGEGVQRELTKQETVQREREDFLPATKLINSTVISIMVNFATLVKASKVAKKINKKKSPI